MTIWRGRRPPGRRWGVDYVEDTLEVVVARDLGPVDFMELPDQDPSGGDLWYGLETSNRGYLTALATADAAGDARLTLYDSSFTKLGRDGCLGRRTVRPRAARRTDVLPQAQRNKQRR